MEWGKINGSGGEGQNGDGKLGAIEEEEGSLGWGLWDQAKGVYWCTGLKCTWQTYKSNEEDWNDHLQGRIEVSWISKGQKGGDTEVTTGDREGKGVEPGVMEVAGVQLQVINSFSYSLIPWFALDSQLWTVSNCSPWDNDLTYIKYPEILSIKHTVKDHRSNFE